MIASTHAKKLFKRKHYEFSYAVGSLNIIKTLSRLV